MIEILIYIALFAVFSVVVTKSFINTAASFSQIRANRVLSANGFTIMERISRDIREAESVDSGSSTLESSPGILKLNSTDSSDDPKTVRFYISAGDLKLEENGLLVGNVSSTDVTINSLIFRSITTSAGSAIKVELTLDYAKGNTNKTVNFSNTIILRGDY